GEIRHATPPFENRQTGHTMSASLQRRPLAGGRVTLRGRLTTAFLVVVLGPVLLGSFSIGTTVATVSRDRTVERLDHAVTPVPTATGPTPPTPQRAESMPPGDAPPRVTLWETTPRAATTPDWPVPSGAMPPPCTAPRRSWQEHELLESRCPQPSCSTTTSSSG